MTDKRPKVFVHTDHNADAVRSFYEIPKALADHIQVEGDARTFTQCLADLIEESSELAR